MNSLIPCKTPLKVKFLTNVHPNCLLHARFDPPKFNLKLFHYISSEDYGSTTLLEISPDTAVFEYNEDTIRCGSIFCLYLIGVLSCNTPFLSPQSRSQTVAEKRNRVG